MFTLWSGADKLASITMSACLNENCLEHFCPYPSSHQPSVCKPGQINAPNVTQSQSHFTDRNIVAISTIDMQTELLFIGVLLTDSESVKFVIDTKAQ